MQAVITTLRIEVFRRASGAVNLAVGFNPRLARNFSSFASATIEFSRR
jgi:hypothetical protein